MTDDTMTETLSMLADAAAGFARPDGARVRALRGKVPPFDRGVWANMAEQGWLSILVPEARGGLGLGLAAVNVIAERLGYAGFPEPFVASGVMVPHLLSASRNDALITRVLPGVLDGATVAVVAWQGETGSLTIGNTGVTTTAAGDDIVLSGTSRFVPVPAADAFIVLAKAAGGLALFWVEREQTGVSCATEPLADGSHSGLLRLANVRVSKSAMVSGPDTAEDDLTYALDASLIASSAELVGLMDRALEMTLDYLKTRQQFGQAIGSFQALQHRAVDLFVQKELSRAAVRSEAISYDDPATTKTARMAAASSAKSRCCDAALLITKEAIQMHGAIGTTDDYDLGLYVNRALVLTSWLGNAAFHRRRFAELTRAKEHKS